MSFNKGDFTQQGVAGHVNANIRLNEKRLVNIDMTSNEEAAGCTITGTVKDLLNDKVYGIGSGVSGNIELTENGENINVAPYATATVNVSGGGGTTWTTVAAEQSGTTVLNSGVNLYFLQLSNVTDFGSPVIKVTLDGNTYYCYWDNQGGAWHDAYYTVVVAATVYMGTAYWGIANVSDTAATTHTGKIERIADYSLAYCTTTQKGYFINNDTGKTIMTSETIGATSYGCEKVTYGGHTLLKVNGGYATFTQGNV